MNPVGFYPRFPRLARAWPLALIFIFVFSLSPNCGQDSEGNFSSADEIIDYFMEYSHSRLEYRLNESTGIPESLCSPDGLPLPIEDKPSDPLEIAYLFLSYYRPLFKICNPSEELKLKRWIEDPDIPGWNHLRFQQYYKNVPVLGAEIFVHLNSRMDVYCVGGYYIPDIHLDTNPAVSSEQAKIQILQCNTEYEISFYENGEPELYIYNDNFYRCREGNNYLIWIIDARFIHKQDKKYDSRRTYVDARSGRILLSFSNLR